MKWTITYQKQNEKNTERYLNCTVLGDYCNNRGLMVLVPERKNERDTGIRKMSYEGIKEMILA